MSEEADATFKALLHRIETLEEEYEAIKDTDPVARGYVGREILALVDSAEVSTEYLRHCEMQVESDLHDSKRARIETMIRIITSRDKSY